MAILKKMYTLLILVLISLNCAASNPSPTNGSAPDWERVKQKNGISVYSRTNVDSDIITVKTTMQVKASVTVIQNILDDVEHRKDWVPFLKQSEIVATLSPQEKLEYTLFAAPWPASDRDFIYRMTAVTQNEDNMVYDMKSEINHQVPEKPGIVRADLVQSTYQLTTLNNGNTQVQLIFHADPKGWLPVWLINIIQRTLPYLMLRNLRELAEQAHQDIHSNIDSNQANK